MALNKELILTLTCLKEVGVKGIGPKKIFSITQAIEDKNLAVNTCEGLATIMFDMEDKAIREVTLSHLVKANLYAVKLINESKAQGIGFVGFYDEDFPDFLRHTINEEGKLDPPLILWYRGDLSITNMPGLAVIGAREATPEGIAGGEFIAGQFAQRGFNIVSGLAIGCDTSGHKGALKANGKTTAILGNGLDYDSIYPPVNRELAKKIVDSGGLLLSEYPIGTTVNRYNLVARDRLQAALAKAALVVQTGEHGGTMHAANTTLLANKPLYAMRYKDDATNRHEKCLGNALLVKKGAKYISGSDDIDKISDFIKSLQ